MTTLILLLALTDHPVDMRRERIRGLSLAACMIEGQIVAAEFVEEHPGWRLLQWRCGG